MSQSPSSYKFFILLFVIATLCSAPTLAQETLNLINIGERLEFYSEILDENRPILIGKPASYENTENRYPLLVLLDGDDHFQYTTGVTSFLARNQLMPEVLVLAIPSIDRYRDLTPPSQNAGEQARRPTLGGADRFLQFVSEELLPWAEENYRVHPYRIIIGHSLGGLFAINALITQPDIFDAYIAISPSLQWNDQGLVEQAENFFADTKELNADLFITAGNEGGRLLGGVRKFSGILDEKAPSGFRWSFSHLAEETHSSIPLKGTYQGLEAIFSEWNLSTEKVISMFEQFGIEALEKYQDFYRASSERLGFEHKIPSFLIVRLVMNLVQQGRWDDASSVLLFDPASYPPPSQLLDMIARGYEAGGQKEQAIALLSMSAEIHLGNESARNKLSSLGIETVSSVPQFPVSREILSSYVGTYKLTPSVILTVGLEDNRLVRYRNGLSPTELHAFSENEFYFLNSDILYQFNVSVDGVAESITIDQGMNGTYRADKVD